MQDLRGILSLLLIQLLGHSQEAPIAVPTLIGQTHDLLLLLQEKASSLLSTYLTAMGLPFSEPGFSLPDMTIIGLPSPSIGYLAWRRLTDGQRLSENYRVYSLQLEYLQLVQDDLQALGLGQSSGKLTEQLTNCQTQIQGLLANLHSLLEALAQPLPAIGEPLDSRAYRTSDFERKLRGYVICREYVRWIDRTLRDFALLSDSVSA
ncbi:cardiotrophin-2-like [Stegostoma tigrinum]|uniref:cardiotrophin-2-like n=2 Tax=Stegostoma tigrinum TaxID=3053191 RepID=UPI0028705555|nr:cardiotrophin-2-like [Stegostoma tigrinum]